MSDSELTRRTVLRTTAGVAVASTGLATLTGSAAAHFPRELAVDIRPGSERNAINPRNQGRVIVAVLQTDAFDPTEAEVRYRFGAPDVVADGGGTEPVSHRTQDVDGDGRGDLVLQFPTAETGFEGDESEGELRWDRDESREHGLSGRDTVVLVGRS
ncbi:hypothetical protein [Haloprofundus salinisoli]|uniref:hypothetical protein n=1 Tax=Haloprofundus salinisoli TaxID=2876193 RepID=UPI001CCE4D0A|nr:hypothetical protein [Haloprofundus salinisoli]